MAYIKDHWLCLNDGTEICSAVPGIHLVSEPTFGGHLFSQYGETLWGETQKLSKEQRQEIADFACAAWAAWVELKT